MDSVIDTKNTVFEDIYKQNHFDRKIMISKICKENMQCERIPYRQEKTYGVSRQNETALRYAEKRGFNVLE